MKFAQIVSFVRVCVCPFLALFQIVGSFCISARPHFPVISGLTCRSMLVTTVVFDRFGCSNFLLSLSGDLIDDGALPSDFFAMQNSSR